MTLDELLSKIEVDVLRDPTDLAVSVYKALCELHDRRALDAASFTKCANCEGHFAYSGKPTCGDFCERKIKAKAIEALERKYPKLRSTE